ncbi:MAG: cell wall-binding repeat-containing protein [Clostridium tyrobutyricum]|jgi:putative cell wall-binding protein|uniref:cell wall-binding repeat-containing protein n=1 Tax=Clostridium tyrobutyricum TaxID=1519 RepID=UPI00242B3BF0|nr:cell wall-binding repeat-containing protein [Clostridium tyrobutyricum]MCH4199696.1 cell wall-binding repeat-containing protein [Clostridium tyrobutyricum]MCH4258235.1 cell wall-binding repeat-containing protein [Clostridium tyrobutyricum]MCI1239404.1 cell wall-binding repeat-containing protein [Clostridium tyrobutyricum]MCI1653117.1 cell wall-binding repeat-containing protein [Clostridium tyrobutyricum]MCI1937560.1 cell wall-binding repeat-containing protein [Clostridium tyrobutyricum]
MNKKGTKALASATLMSLVLTTALATGNVKAAANGQATRVGGTDRYETAAKVATTNFTTSDNVVLVSGEGYADSVSASVLAKKLDAPIVLTGSKTLDANAKSAIETLKAKNVYIIGGTGSISQDIEDGLKSDYTVTRLGGQDRYATNLAIANKLVDLGVSKSNIIAVAGTGFADALSVAPVAAADNEILLLTKNDTDAMKATADFAKDSNVTVVGTTNVVNGDIYNQLNADKRIDGGADRFATNINVLKAFDNDLKADKLYVANATQANPDNLYADALVASAIAGKYSAPLVLVDKDGSTGTTNAINYIGTKATKDTDLQVVGGTGVISDATVQSIEDAVKDKDTDPEVSSITANGLNQIKVVFNQEVDEDTAKDVTNYKVDGSSLKDDGSSYASLQDDNKTVLITLGDSRKQYDKVDVTVKKGILTADKSKTVPEFTQNVTFSDTTVPTLDSVEARGNNKLTVKFSEPVNLGKIGSATIDDGDLKVLSNTNFSNFLSKFKIDGQNITGFGLDSDLTLAKNAVESTEGDVYADEVDFYFNSSLTNGNKTLKISDGDKDAALSDAAGFTFQETSQDFNIDTLTTTPQITSVTGDDSGKVYINFDRAMDSKSAIDTSNYSVNDESSNVTNAKLENNDTQVKLTVSGLNKGSNKVNIKNTVKDAYGNKVADDTYKSFDLTEDTTKPTVNSVATLDDTTIRVKFSKDVNVTYATSTSNYKLKDNSGNDITNTSKGITSITVPGGATDTASVFDIHVGDKLTDSQYALTIKNIQDTASTPNVMDDYTTTFAGSDSVAPVADDDAIALENTNDSTNPYRKVVVTFNKAMDASSLTNTSNYKFKNASGDTKALPSGTTISTSSDNKSATIEFPSAYGTYGTDGQTYSKSGDNLITDIAVIGVKDANGNALDVSQVLPVTTVSATPVTNVKANSIKVYYDGDNLKVNLAFDKSIDNLDYTDFTLNEATPDSGYKNSDGTITLVYNDGGTKIAQVKRAGINAKLNIGASSNTKDVTGRSLVAVADADNIVPYYYQAAPKTLVTKSVVDGVTYATNWNADADAKKVTVQFDTPIEQSSVKPGDFTFVVDGTTLNAKTATVGTIVGTNDNTVTFDFKNGNNTSADLAKFVAGASVKITPNSSNKISTLEDKNDSYAYYVPSNNDLKSYTVTANSTFATGVTSTVAQKVSGTEITVPQGATVEQLIAGTNGTTAAVKDSAGVAKTTGALVLGDIATIDGTEYTIVSTDGILTTTAGTISGTTITVPSTTTVETLIADTTPTVTVKDSADAAKTTGALVKGDKVIVDDKTYTIALN